MINYDNKAWYKHVFVWRGSVIQGVFVRILMLTLWTAFIVFLFENNIIPKSASVDMVVFNVIGLALGLLLVFRTNTSYDRWWEGRKLLGANVTATRNVVFVLDGIIPQSNKALREEFAELFVSFHIAVKERLRDGVQPGHLPMLRREYSQTVFQSEHVALAILKLIREKIEALRRENLNRDPEFLCIYNDLAAVTGNMGGLERIRFTPIPFAYASHSQLFMMIYFLALPLGLYDKLTWLSIPVMFFISLILVGINEIGVEIEDPFGNDANDLPVDSICNSLQKNIYEILLK
jgi:ion channel-forming bestrophin family protein